MPTLHIPTNTPGEIKRRSQSTKTKGKRIIAIGWRRNPIIETDLINLSLTNILSWPPPLWSNKICLPWQILLLIVKRGDRTSPNVLEWYPRPICERHLPIHNSLSNAFSKRHKASWKRWGFFYLNRNARQQPNGKAVDGIKRGGGELRKKEKTRHGTEGLRFVRLASSPPSWRVCPGLWSDGKIATKKQGCFLESREAAIPGSK